MDAAEFDQSIRALTFHDRSARPFLCEGLPFDCKIFLVGINPGTDTLFWPHWTVERGCDKAGWLREYLNKHKRYGPTRARIERLVEAIAPLRCAETNVFALPSPREADLVASKRDTSIFDFLLHALKPRIVFAHGGAAVAHLARGARIPLDVFIPTECNGVKFDLIAGHHLAYQWSFAKVDNLANRIRERYYVLKKSDP